MELTMWIHGNTNKGYGEKGIVLKGANERIVSVRKEGDSIVFAEECDGWFEEKYSKEDAIIIASELLEWIKNN